MSFEQNLRSYLGHFDGTPKDFSEVEYLFDSVYDDDFIVFDGDGLALNKQQMKKLHKGLLELGSKATVISVQELSPDSFEFQFRMTNSRFDVVIHTKGNVKNGRLIKASAVKSEDSKSLLEAQHHLLNHYDVIKNFHTYTAVHDGMAKPYDQMERAFEDLLHKDFVDTMGGVDSPMVKNEVREKFTKFFFALGTKAELIEYTPLNNFQFDAKFRFTNRAFDIKNHGRGTIKDGKLVKMEPYDDAKLAYQNLKKSHELYNLIQNMRTYESLVNRKLSTSQDIEKSVDSMFHDDFVGDEPGCGPKKDGAKEKILEDFADKAKIRFEKIEVVDDSHIEIVISKEKEWRRHQVLTVKQAKIARIDSVADIEDLVYNLNKYAELQNSGGRATVQDMEFVLDSIFHDDFVGEDPGCWPKKAVAKKNVLKDFAEQAPIYFEKMEVVDDSHLDVIITKKGDWRRHQIFTVEDGKMVRVDTVYDLEGQQSKVALGLNDTPFPVSAQ